MTFKRLTLGRTGEELAAAYLAEAGYEIIGRNYRCLSGEIDIVAVDNDVLAFIEVKTRSSTVFGHPLEAIGVRKQHKIARSAQDYLMVNKIKDRACRFDVVSVLIRAGSAPEIELIKNAFEYNG